MWIFLEKFNTIAGFIGFFISLGTLVLSLRVNYRVNQIMERADYRENYREHSGTAEGFLEIIASDNFDPKDLAMNINDFSTDIKTKYTFLPYKIKAVLKQLENCEFKQIKSNHAYKIKTRKLLRELKNYLEKEAKK